MKNQLFIKSLSALYLLLCSMLANADQFVGYAYDIKSKELVYIEHHEYKDSTTHHVTYKEVDGQTFAEKKIDYQRSFTSPSFVQTNSRNGEQIKIVKQDESLLVEYKENMNEKTELDALEITPTLVIDAGFDHYISQNWDALITGKALVVDYLVPSSLAAYQLSIEQYDCDNQERYCFTISASNFFISMFADELSLSYDKVSRKLMSFQGRSNICDENGDYQDVLISYDYVSVKEASL